MHKILSIVLFLITLNNLNAREVYSLKDVILNKQKDYYTIVLATVAQTQNYSYIESDENVSYNVIAYDFGQRDKYVKILFGAYKSYDDAFRSLMEISTVHLANQPYIEKIDKHINLFFKYQNEQNHK